MATPIVSASLFFHCLVYLLFIFCYPPKESHALHGEETTLRSSHDYYTVKVHSLLLASCNTSSSTGKGEKEASLKLVHSSKLPSGRAPTLARILARDRARRHSLLSRHTLNPQSAADVPAFSGQNAFEISEYLVTVGMGTPTRYVSLVFDTGSDITWTQCKPCKKCYKQLQPIFDSYLSKTYQNVPCKSPLCSRLSATTCSKNTCIFQVSYGDNSFSIGNLATEKLTLTPTQVFPNFVFGCGRYNGGPNGLAAGVMGLGQDKSSIVSQTASNYGKYFSYCLPPVASCSPGHLSFGKPKSTKAERLKFTPIWSPFPIKTLQTQYSINITGIKVAGKTLPISEKVFRNALNLIDSGTTITSIPDDAYAALRAAFRRQMKKYPRTEGMDPIDTCYDLSKYKTVKIPKVSLFFAGDVEVPIAPSGILTGDGVSQMCLMFSPINSSDQLGLFGNTQQQSLEVAYDVEGQKIGFATGGCA